jgi:hypothetical protein
MLKHCSQSCVDVSRRSLRHGSFTLDSRFGLSADFLEELDLEEDLEFRSFCLGQSTTTSSGGYHSMATLPRNRPRANPEACVSLPNISSVSAIKVYAQCLRPHLAYKTVIITRHTTSKQVVLGLLSRFRMRHRDPRLFYLTMEVNIGEARSRTIALEDGSCIADLITCNPWGACKFRLKARQGGLVKIHDSEIRPDSVYKSIILSQDTTVEDTISILRNCYHTERSEEYSLHEFCTVTLTSRLLEGSEKPLEIQEKWRNISSKVFQLRRLQHKGPVGEVAKPVQVFSRDLVRNSILRQSIRKKHFLSSMIYEDQGLDPEARNCFSLGRFSLSHQVISESNMEDNAEAVDSDNEVTSGEEGELNSSTSGVSSMTEDSLSCSSSGSLGVCDANSFYM